MLTLARSTLPLLFGSGKLGTPWARMHFAHSSRDCRYDAGIALGVVVVPRFATDGVSEPPQPAASTARAATTAATEEPRTTVPNRTPRGKATGSEMALKAVAAVVRFSADRTELRRFGLR